jgi:threonine dehydratase
MAVRVPVPAALDVIVRGAARVVEVTDAEVEDAIRAYFSDTHQIAEGAGAAPLAALQKEGARAGRRAAVILGGGNIDRDLYLRVLAGGWT